MNKNVLAILETLRLERVYLLSNLIENIDLHSQILKYRHHKKSTQLVMSLWKERSRLLILNDLHNCALDDSIKKSVCEKLFNSKTLEGTIAMNSTNFDLSQKLLAKSDGMELTIRKIRFNYEKAIAKIEDMLNSENLDE